MPNWCSTNITINGEDNPNELKILWDHLQKATAESAVPNGFGDTWLGNLVEYLGHDWQEVSCRGSITYMNLTDDNQIIIDQEDAWTPKLEPVYMMVQKYAPSAEFIYTAYEPGCEIYDSNDPEIIGTWYIDAWDYDNVLPTELIDCDEYLSTEELYGILSKYCKSKGTIYDLVREMEQKYDSIMFHQFEEASIDDYWL